MRDVRALSYAGASRQVPTVDRVNQDNRPTRLDKDARTCETVAMFRAFLGGLASMVGWRVGEAVIDGARREVGRGVRNRNISARAAYETELIEAARQLPAGTPAAAIIVVSSAQIEPQLGRFTCLACDAPMDLVQHRATTEDCIAVRALDLACRSCGGPRTAYFRIERPD